MLFREKIINFIYTKATSTKKIRTLLTPIGAFFFTIFTTLFVLISFEIDKILGITKFLPDAAPYFSIPLVAFGIGLSGWSIFHFLKVKGTPVPINPPPLLITNGPYKYIRNPMLTGLFFILFGLGIGFNSFFLVFIFTPLFIAINVFELKQIEEPELIKRLGEDYSIYRDNTPMFIPGIGPKKKITG